MCFADFRPAATDTNIRLGRVAYMSADCPKNSSLLLRHVSCERIALSYGAITRWVHRFCSRAIPL